jgi:hypothetical protein
LPQFPNAATFGTRERAGLWLAWHSRFGDVSVDLVDDAEYRPLSPAHPEDAGVFTFSDVAVVSVR